MLGDGDKETFLMTRAKLLNPVMSETGFSFTLWTSQIIYLQNDLFDLIWIGFLNVQQQEESW